MRLLMLASSFPLFAGDGTAPFIEQIVRAVARRGHAVDLVLPRHPRLVTEGRTGDLPIRLFPFFAGPRKGFAWGYASSMQADRRLRASALAIAPVAALAALSKLRQRIAMDRYDLVHVHWLVPNGPIAAVAARSAGLPLVVGLHGSDVFVAERQAALGWLARRVLAASRGVVACSGDLGRRAAALGGLEGGPEVIPYGVDVEAFSGGDGTRWRERAGVGEGEVLVVAVGRLVAKKGFVHLVRAAARLRDRGAPVRIAIGGDGDLEGELQAEARRLGVADRVRLLGRIAHDEVRDLLAAADVVAVPSVRDEEGNVDGLPNSLLEGLAAGRAVVASRIAGIPDVVVDGENGWLVPAGDPEALASALAELAADRDARETLARGARASAARLSWDAHAERLLAVYERALGRGAPA